MKKIIVGLLALFFSYSELHGAAKPEKKWWTLISQPINELAIFKESHDLSLPGSLRDPKLFDGSINMVADILEIKLKEGVLLKIPYYIIAYFLEPRFACINGLAPVFCNCYVYTNKTIFKEYSKPMLLKVKLAHSQALDDLSVIKLGNCQIPDIDSFPYEPIPSPRELSLKEA
ncbi:hypothetical protein K2W90_03850 [Candidatus Babeliales bacterium]|nr:hypothetical protein [Candidatus Babeliales bacterium]